jgi:hypothetical protein
MCWACYHADRAGNDGGRVRMPGQAPREELPVYIRPELRKLLRERLGDLGAKSESDGCNLALATLLGREDLR